MKTNYIITLFVFIAVNMGTANAQDSTQSCKVLTSTLVGKYTGPCKKGLANGNGDAVGVNHYTGAFRDGTPTGKGIYYYGDTAYYSGNLQDGIREGKGEMHYLKKGLPDSVVKGYWSADVYTGKEYITYTFDGASLFDTYNIAPSDNIGNTITFNLTSGSGSPTGGSVVDGAVLNIADLVSTNGVIVRKLSNFGTANAIFVTYDLSSFPANLYVTLSDGRSFQLNLSKAAEWRVQLYQNK